MEQRDGALDERRLARVASNQSLRPTHAPAGTRCQDKPAHVCGSPMHRRRVGNTFLVTHMREPTRGAGSYRSHAFSDEPASPRRE
ncbi:hypothetical protein GCM10009868_33630 [Terrabacter aerolatus]|uniref:Uncharacterized protein n=1 Tax=Terrabacter aerolatus TaxID=422442 RepID=A0A512CWR5_9MICO|nr:hypothetical protein TAE01_04630 [Terrabacter aerolatus]